MRNLLLITHPEVIIDRDRPIHEWLLSKRGLERVHNLLKQVIWNDVDAVFTSPENKAYIVAEMAAMTFNLPYEIRRNLAEIDRSSTGFVQYEVYMAMMRRFYENPQQNIRGWESANDATERVWGCVQRLAKENPRKTIAIVGHGAIFTLLLCKILNRPPSFGMDPGKVGCYAEVDWRDKRIITPWMGY